jgi:thiol-disulfide isomerase/thioredoxin
MFRLRPDLRFLLPPLFLLISAILVFLWLKPKNSDLKGVDFNSPVQLFGENADIIHSRFISTPDFNLLKGKKALSFFSLKCTHCRKGAQQISAFASQHQLEQHFLVFFSGREINVKWFYDTSGSVHFPYRMLEKEYMSIITGGQVPQLILLKDGIVEEVLYFDEETEAELSKFFKP